MVVDQLAECPDASDHPRDRIGTTEDWTIDFDRGLPSGAGEFAEQTAVVATVDPQPLGNREDELPVGDRAQIVCAIVSAVIRDRLGSVCSGVPITRSPILDLRQ